MGRLGEGAVGKLEENTAIMIEAVPDVKFPAYTPDGGAFIRRA